MKRQNESDSVYAGLEEFRVSLCNFERFDLSFGLLQVPLLVPATNPWSKNGDDSISSFVGFGSHMVWEFVLLRLTNF